MSGFYVSGSPLPAAVGKVKEASGGPQNLLMLFVKANTEGMVSSLGTSDFFSA